MGIHRIGHLNACAVIPARDLALSVGQATLAQDARPHQFARGADPWSTTRVNFPAMETILGGRCNCQNDAKDAEQASGPIPRMPPSILSFTHRILLSFGGLETALLILGRPALQRYRR